MLDAFTWYKQAALKWKGRGLTVHIDPWGIPEGEEAADLVLITHAHFDHFNPEDFAKVVKEGTIIVAPEDVARDCVASRGRPRREAGARRSRRPGSRSMRSRRTTSRRSGSRCIRATTTGSATSSSSAGR